MAKDRTVKKRVARFREKQRAGAPSSQYAFVYISAEDLGFLMDVGLLDDRDREDPKKCGLAILGLVRECLGKPK